MYIDPTMLVRSTDGAAQARAVSVEREMGERELSPTLDA